MNLIALVTGLGIPARFAKPVLIGVGVLLIVLVFFVAIKIHDHGVIKDHQAQMEHRAGPAMDKAAQERAADTIQIDKTTQERKNAIQSQPDQPIAPTSHALACQRLRQRGHAPASCG